MKVSFIVPCSNLVNNGIRTISSYLKSKGHQVKLIFILVERNNFRGVLSQDVLNELCELVSASGLIGISVMTNFLGYAQQITNAINSKNKSIPIVWGGVQPTVDPERCMRDVGIICRGEGEKPILELVETLEKGWSIEKIKNLWVNKGGKIYRNEVRWLIKDLNVLPDPDYNLSTQLILKNHHFIPLDQNILKDNMIKMGSKSRYSVFTSRGCPGKCLVGDTLVNTIYGPIPIKELVDKYETVPVWTYDLNIKEVVLADAINIRKVGTQEEIVRVEFEEGGHIDCTPDHRFLVFNNGNQFSPQKEWEVEAKDLKEGQSVRSYRETKWRNYFSIEWARKRKQIPHLIMEYLLDRALIGGECVHHLDGNTFNNDFSNLILCTSNSDHLKRFHSEDFSLRMKEDNPAKNMTSTWIENISKANKGRKLSQEHKEKLSISKIGEKNPNWRKTPSDETKKKQSEKKLGSKRSEKTKDRISKSGLERWRKKKEVDLNYKVKVVTFLEEKQDIYCLEVPKTGWFFVNNVLVHNCTFCINDSLKDLYQGKGLFVRKRSVKRVIQELKENIKTFGFESVCIQDEDFMVRTFEEIKEFCEDYKKEINLPFQCEFSPRTFNVDKITELIGAGLSRVQVGIQSVNEGTNYLLYDRKYSMEDIDKVVGFFSNYPEIICNLHFLVHNPWESEDSLISSIRYVSKLSEVFNIKLYPLVFYPGTRIYDRAFSQGLIKDFFEDVVYKDWSQNRVKDSDYLTLIFYLLVFIRSRKVFYKWKLSFLFFILTSGFVRTLFKFPFVLHFFRSLFTVIYLSKRENRL